MEPDYLVETSSCQPLYQLDDGDWMVEVTLVESGEKAEYPLTHLADDPEAP